MTKIIWGVLFLIGMLTTAAASAPVSVPAPEMGEGAIGMLLAAGAVFLIKRCGR